MLLVFVTSPPGHPATRIANTLITRRLAACVNIIPRIDSIFWWKGKVSRSREALLMIKTTSAAYPRLEATVRKLHPYELPEIIAVRIGRGYRPYTQWVAASIQSRAGHR